jgi:hypothetical protein
MQVLLLLLVGFVTQPAPARYTVSAAPLDVGSSGKLCIAVDSTDPHGIWWWESGTDNCATRDTGPGVFKADEATVSTDNVGVRASFRLGLHGLSPQPDHLDVRLVIAGSRMRSQSGDDVPVVYRADLKIPARFGRVAFLPAFLAALRFCLAAFCLPAFAPIRATASARESSPCSCSRR